MRFTVFCVLLLGVSATWRGCGDQCDNSNQCNDALCSKCSANFPQKGVCISGATCNATCILDSDCERLRYCYQCTQGRCSPGPLYPVQCKDCSVDSDCNPSSNCRKCLTDTTVKAGKRCAAGCGGKCANNYDCGYGTQCSRCDPSTNTCQKGSGCGSTCGVDADCDQGGLCHLCIDFTCSVPCNSKCSKMEDCNGPITGCGICQNGDCVPGIICGSRCLYDRDCANAGQCTSCTNGKCAAASACGSTCTNSTQCGNSQCPACIGGKCATAQCGSSCTQASDCAQAGNCTSCTLGQCTQPACGSDCNSNGDCALASGGCTTCRGGQCSAPTCGSPCSTASDCAHAGPCIDCKDGACTYRPPPNCEDHAPCTPGNNNQCPNTTCSRCDPFTATCRIGGPCGAACIVQTDCNQMLAECKYCRDICTGLPEFLQAAKTEFGDLPVEDLQALEDAKRLKEKLRLT